VRQQQPSLIPLNGVVFINTCGYKKVKQEFLKN
jgi:hypothetical protein